MGRYETSGGSLLPTFRDKVSIPSSSITKFPTLKIGRTRFFEKSVTKYLLALRIIPEDRRSHTKTTSFKNFARVNVK